EQPVAPLPAGAAGDDPAARLAERHARYIRALLDRGWLRWDTVEPNHVRLGLWAAVASVWRQAWPLRDVYLRVSDARSRRLLARRGLDVRKLTGSAMTVAVGRQSVPAGPVDGVRAGHAHARILAGQIDPAALLETVVAELENESAGGAVIAEVRYSFRSYRDEIRRRIRRHCGFDLVLDPKAGALSATAAERDFDRASDDAEWRALTARAPFEPLIFDPWMRDLDQVLPAARTALAGSRDQPLKWDSASLYLDNRRLCWQIVAWADDDTPLFVVLDARSGAVLN
ncbi:MAG: hypothetical protein JNK31_09210, partial [Candidatus Competibacter sp.]|nr:hypothetical protein [Candidatus Competibacter sp.]